MQQEQQKLLQSSSNNQGQSSNNAQVPNQTSSQHTSRIHEVRFNKQLQFLTKYTYTLNSNQSGRSIIISNLWEDPNEFINADDGLGERANILGTQLCIQLPKDYPFRPPKFIHNKTENLTIAELIDQWSPRFKIMEMIQLIKKRIQQRKKLQFETKNNTLFHIFKAMDSVWFWVLIAILIRICVGLGNYSGKSDWPNLGDFQAHRNWMSVSFTRPIQKWYTQTEEKPWWRIDYPPIAAYISYIFAWVYNHFEPKALEQQKGYQSQNLFAYMRGTVMLVDCVFLIPPILLISFHCLTSLKNRYWSLFVAFMFITLIKPDLILIDHGHFQYNSLMLGLILYSYYFLITGKVYLCCIFYTIAVNSKLMAVYFTPAFIAGLIGITRKKYSRSNRSKAYRQFSIYFAIIILTLFVIWYPWLGSKNTLMTVIHAIFPIHRGLYQLKVPNFWCISDVIFKYQTWIMKKTLALICLIGCALLSIPSMTAIIMNPSPKILVIGFSCISMTFFLFAYHVHEKSILVPLCIIPFISQYLGGNIVMDLVIGGCVGMYHLLKQDGQKMQYFILVIAYIIFSRLYYHCQQKFIKIYKPESSSFYHDHHSTKHVQTTLTLPERVHFKLFSYNSLVHKLFIYGGFAVLHCCQLFVEPPSRLPYLWNLLFAFYSFVLNSYFTVICNWILIEQIRSRVRGFKKE